MKKGLVLMIALFAAALFAAPSTYNMLKLPAGSTLTADGDISDWNDAYIIDSVRSDNNVFYRPTLGTWTRSTFQYYVYGAHDDNRAYWACRVVADDSIGVGGTYGSDCMKINPGGQAAAFYIWSDGTIKKNPSSPYTVGVDMDAKVNATGSLGTLPVYEFYIDKATLDQFGLAQFQFCVGTEDNDRLYLGVGVEYLGNKIVDGNQWDNQLYFPTWIFSTTEGPSTGVQKRNVNLSAERLNASPNPFAPATILSYDIKNSGTLKIYDINGKTVMSSHLQAGPGKKAWNGTDLTGRSVSSGIYMARVTSGNRILDARLFLTR